MPSASYLGSLNSGHVTYPPSLSIEGSLDVMVENQKALRQGDSFIPHVNASLPFDSHPCTVSTGSSTVMVNNKPMARIGDSTICGAVIITGCATVQVG